MTTMSSGYVEVDGGRLYFEVAGDGPPAALIHPGLWDRRAWDDQFEPFAERHCVVRYDLRGYGRSSRHEAGRPYSHIRDLGAVLDAVGIDRAALLGCSVGGRVGLDFALTHPERVSALVLVAPAVSGMREGTPEEEAWYAERWAPIGSAIDAGELERAMDLALSTFWAVLGTDDPVGARIREIAFDNLHVLTMDESGDQEAEPPAIERLEEVSAPTLVLPADHDPPWTWRLCRVLAERIPNARLVQIPNTDHVVNMRQPARFNQVALEFLGEVG